MSLSLSGMAKLKAALTKASLQAELASGAASRAGGEVVAHIMADQAPRDTGTLASRIALTTIPLPGGAVTKVGSEVPYDRFVQYGTIHMSAQPYGIPSANASIPGVIGSMIPIFKLAIEG